MYFKVDSSERPIKKPGPVLVWVKEEDGNYNACVFCCPCGEREIYVSRPPHKEIRFDAEGRLTVSASIKSVKPTLGKCHFFVTEGQFKMCDDSTCPGKKFIDVTTGNKS